MVRLPPPTLPTTPDPVRVSVPVTIVRFPVVAVSPIANGPLPPARVNPPRLNVRPVVLWRTSRPDTVVSAAKVIVGLAGPGVLFDVNVGRSFTPGATPPPQFEPALKAPPAADVQLTSAAAAGGGVA